VGAVGVGTNKWSSWGGGVGREGRSAWADRTILLAGEIWLQRELELPGAAHPAGVGVSIQTTRRKEHTRPEDKKAGDEGYRPTY